MSIYLNADIYQYAKKKPFLCKYNRILKFICIIIRKDFIATNR